MTSIDRYRPNRSSARPGFPELVAQVIAAKRSRHTKDAYTADFARWRAFCDEMGFDSTRPSIEATTAFRDTLVDEVSETSARRMLAGLSSIAGALHRRGELAANPFHPALLAWPAVSRRGVTPAVDDTIVQAMLAEAEADEHPQRSCRDTLVVRLLYDTGMRRSSVVSIKRDEIRRPRGGGLEITAFVKGGTEEVVFAPRVTEAALEDWLEVGPESPFLFPGKSGKKPLNETVVNKIVRRLGEAVGEPDVSPHWFRSAFITAALGAEGVKATDVQGSVHHTDIRTTQIYDRERRGAGVAEAVSKKRGGR